MITLGHVNIRTTRLEETCAFYEKILGFRRVTAATNPDPGRNLWLADAAGNPSVHVNVFRPGEQVAPGSGYRAWIISPSSAGQARPSHRPDHEFARIAARKVDHLLDRDLAASRGRSRIAGLEPLTKIFLGPRRGLYCQTIGKI